MTGGGGAFELCRVSRAYGDVRVLRKASARFETGRTHVLMGPSGAGKTTVLRLLLGLEAPDAGEVVRPAGARLAATFQEDRLLDGLTATVNVRAPHGRRRGSALEAFLAREAMGETGMTDGFAVPHAQSTAIKDAAVIVVKNDRPVEWPSFDEKPVDVAIALLVPDTDVAATHIKLLSKTAVLLMRDEFKNLVHGTDDPQVIADAINAGLNED